MQIQDKLATDTFLNGVIFIVSFVIVIILGVVTMAPFILRNMVWVSVASQSTQRDWTAWGIGLRQIEAKNVALTLSEPTEFIWTSESHLGIKPFVGERFISYLPDCDYYNLKLQRLLYTQQWLDAESLLKVLLRQCPGWDWSRLQLGLIYDRLNQPALAIQAFEQAGISRYAVELIAANYLQLAAECNPDRPSSVCIDWFNHIHQLVPNHLYALQWSAAFTMQFDPVTVDIWHEPRLNHYVALAAIKSLQNTDRSWSDTLFPLARRLAWNRSIDSTLLLYTAVSEHEPENFLAHYFTGLAAISLRNWEFAKTALVVAVNLRPQSINAQLALARTYVHLNNLTQALYYYESALQKEPCIPEALDFLGKQLSTEKKFLQQANTCKISLDVVFEAESLPGWGNIIFDKNASGQHVRQGNSNFVIYGPAISLPAGRYEASFYLRMPAFLKSQCIRLDVFDDANQLDGAWLTDLPQRWIEPKESLESGYKPFSVVFVSPQGGEFQFRVLEVCGSDVFVDRVEIHPL